MGPRKTYRVCGYQRISSLAASTGLTIPTRAPDGSTCSPNAVIFQAETQSVRWRDDGTAPTTAIGVLLPVNLEPFYYDGNLQAIRFIETAASAVMNVVYFEDVNQT